MNHHDPTGAEHAIEGGRPDDAPQAPGGMSHWRWLLFSIMAQLESREDVYLNIPNAITTQRDVHVATRSSRGEVAD